VKAAVDALLQEGRTEFGVLLDLPSNELERATSKEIAASILAMREGRVEIRPGYDGVFGVVKTKGIVKKRQVGLL
jgi:PHP family Zn ribbon phosphoesterase